ncbi:beta-lactamase-like protein [Hypoxylon sp. FL1150]|nr:beta-lactamase-like protein [Hypoxylon sp. FL1150]
MASLPELNIPASTSTVNVSIINTEGTIRGLDTLRFFEPKIPGHDYLAAPIYTFLIQHPTLNRTILFDLGIRKDWWNWPAKFVEGIKSTGVTLDVPKDVREILDEHDVDTNSIEAVVWSHMHLDHTGDPSTFEPSTALVVGPGCKKEMFPGYPANPDASRFVLEKDYAGRDVRELDFGRSGLRIGKFPAVDYFGDGSFFLLDSPGHCIGHVCGLARVTSDPDSFILMGGDIVHHDGELRPHRWHPLPDAVSPHPFLPRSAAPCPGELFDKVLRDGRDQPFYRPTQKAGDIHFDPAEAAESIRKLQELDAYDDILVVPAHDQYLLGVADFFPKSANDFAKKGWAKKARWLFLADFAKALGFEGEIEAAGDYGPVSTGK